MTLVRAVTVLFVLCSAGLVAFVYWPAASARGGSALAGGTAGGGDAPTATPIGQFIPLDTPRPAPDVSFTTRDGKPVRLADFRGRTVLVNLWATWCAPCVHEMPSLERLQTTLGKDLAILAISEDRRGAEVVDPFVAKLDLKALAIYLDPKGGISRSFGAHGLPTSILIDREGRILGRLEGAAEWDSAAMVARLRQYIASPPPVQKASNER